MTRIKTNKEGYDNALKGVFSHAIMVEYLLRGFVPEPWVKSIDFSSLMRSM